MARDKHQAAAAEFSRSDHPRRRATSRPAAKTARSDGASGKNSRTERTCHLCASAGSLVLERLIVGQSEDLVWLCVPCSQPGFRTTVS
jgi:hypothetical protein